MNPGKARIDAEQTLHVGSFLKAHVAVLIIVDGLTRVREEAKQDRVSPGPDRDYADAVHTLGWGESVRDATLAVGLFPGLRDRAARELQLIARNEILPGVMRKNVDDFWWQPLLESLNEAYDAAEALDRTLVEYQDRLEGVGALTAVRFATSNRRREEYLEKLSRLRPRASNTGCGDVGGE
ncbi:hypothetical protein GE09DRAFT_1226217 [Coniochaeta sp. 2T2.1]|nr:hypothetical protein GE09DRAFT_1226217 [Coniochaeta sp. 2T2.1]